MKSVSVGMIGSGFSARFQVAALRKVYGVDVRVAAVASRQHQSAAEFAHAHQIPKVYGDYRELLTDPDLDVVSICVPNSVHSDVTIEAARAGKHVICEKPLTGAFGLTELTGASRAAAERERVVATLDDVETAIRESGVLFMYAENWVYAPATSKIKRLLDVSQGSILDIRAEQGHSGSHAAASRRRETAGGGALITLGAHPIGAALHLKQYESRIRGTDPVRAESVMADIGALQDSVAWQRESSHDWLVSDWSNVETWANLAITFTDGSKAVINASFAMLGGVRDVLEVYTTNAAYHSKMAPNDQLRAYTPDASAFGSESLHEKVESRAGWNYASPDDEFSRGYPQEMQDFMEAVAHKREPVSDLALARDVVEVIYAGYQSAEEGRRISLV